MRPYERRVNRICALFVQLSRLSNRTDLSAIDEELRTGGLEHDSYGTVVATGFNDSGMTGTTTETRRFCGS